MGGTGSSCCYRHPNRATAISCARCGRPICPGCMIPASVGFQCPECVREGNASIRPVKRRGGLRAAGRRWGAVTLTLIAINVLMFVVTAVAAAVQGFSPLDNDFSTLFGRLAQSPLTVRDGQWWRVLTAAFLHIGPVHLVLNLMALLIFGTELENRLGARRFLSVYLLALVGSAAATQLFGDPLVSVAGASGAIYGLLGALAVLMLSRREQMRSVLTLLVIYVAFSFVPGISLLGHLGGLVTGALSAGLVVLTRRRLTAQIVALTCLAVLLVVLVLAVPTVAVLGF